MKLLLIKGLAQNILLELYPRITASDKISLSTNQYLILRKSISTLLFAIGLDHKYNNNDKICDILEKFAVGTQ